ncbi:MAG: hypothetical protein QOE86_2428, partial [Solirubrobacteraceae bacterium]|nr:hypothetical protein [Solirubrobacteraceae bacterium]
LYAAVLIAFACGLVFASGFDLTKISWAQTRSPQASKPTPQEVKPLEETGQAFEAIAEHVTPAVVSIEAEQLETRTRTPQQRRNVPPGMEDFFRQFEQQDPQPRTGTGSGFIVTKDGYIMTNNHVVADADRVTVTLLDNRKFPAKVIGRDPTTDVAVIKVDPKGLRLKPLALGDSKSVQVGDPTVAIGNPFGFDRTLTTGVVSALQRQIRAPDNYTIENVIQTDAAINPGNSGGPLIDAGGRVIGINSQIATGGNGSGSVGIGFAVPIDTAKQVVAELKAHGRVERPWLGVDFVAIDPSLRQLGVDQSHGLLVQAVRPGGPAARAGIAPGDRGVTLSSGEQLAVGGDVVTAVDGRPTSSTEDLRRALAAHRPGDTVSLTVRRGGRDRMVDVTLGNRPAGAGQ